MGYIDDIMGFNPGNLEAFQTPAETFNYDANIYKTNPVKLSKTEDGHYHSRVRIIYNPFNVEKSIVDQRTYFIQDAEGSLLVRSKGASPDPKVYRECPFHKAWSKLWYDEVDQARKREWSREMLDNSNSRWVLVQVLEDDNQPELVGKILAWKLPTTIYNKAMAKMKPSAESKKTPVSIMDWLIGLPLDIDVAPGPDDPKAPERKQREINYDLCDFDTDCVPIMRVDGTPLFTDEELETIDAYATARNEVAKAKSETKKKAAMDQVQTMMNGPIRDLYQKAYDYLKENAFDLEKECGYQEWDEATAARVEKYLAAVVAMQDPKIPTVVAYTEAAPTSVVDAPVAEAGTSAPDPIAGFMDEAPF
jgi:hypothetical protein